MRMRFVAAAAIALAIAAAPGIAGRAVAAPGQGAGQGGAAGFVARVGDIAIIQADKSTLKGGALSERNVLRRFYGADTGEPVAAFRQDAYHSVAIYSSFETNVKGAFAYTVNVRNTVEHIGLGAIDNAGTYGSGGRLRSYLLMNDLLEFPPDPGADIAPDRPYSHRVLVTHEFLHTFGIALDSTEGRITDGGSHWSLLFDTRGEGDSGSSVEHGARWSPDPLTVDPASFPRTFAVDSRPFQGYSQLDRYLLGDYEDLDLAALSQTIEPRGLLKAKGVQVFEEASQGKTVTAQGVARVTIESIVSAMGGVRRETDPELRTSPVYRMAFVLVVPASTTPAEVAAVDLKKPEGPLAEAIVKLEGFREDFEDAFNGGFPAQPGAEVEPPPGMRRVSIDTRLAGN